MNCQCLHSWKSNRCIEAINFNTAHQMSDPESNNFDRNKLRLARDVSSNFTRNCQWRSSTWAIGIPAPSLEVREPINVG